MRWSLVLFLSFVVCIESLLTKLNSGDSFSYLERKFQSYANAIDENICASFCSQFMPIVGIISLRLPYCYCYLPGDKYTLTISQNLLEKFYAYKRCDVNQYWDGSMCNSCPQYTVADMRATSVNNCSYCGPGKFYRDQICNDCVAGKYNNQEALLGIEQYTCTWCEIGKFSNTSGSTVCMSCEAGKYQDERAKTSCKYCWQDNSYSLSGWSLCQECNHGTLLKLPKRDGCVACEAGKYWYIHSPGIYACADCAGGLWSSTGETECTGCQAGYYGYDPSTKTCSACAKGKYSLAMSLECTYCPAGKFSSMPRSPSCTSCNSYSDYMTTVSGTSPRIIESNQYDVIGANTSDFCHCRRGYYRDASSQKCMLCAKGTYSNDIRSATSCVSCPAYTTTSSFGSVYKSECTECSANAQRVDGQCYPSEGYELDGKASQFQTPECPLQQKDIMNTSFLVTTGLGGYSYEEVFGVDHRQVDFQCSTTCDGQGLSDTQYCGGPWACNTATCMTQANDRGEEPRACPVTLARNDSNLYRKSLVSCAACSTCGNYQYSFRSLKDRAELNWGEGCAKECSMMLCDYGEIYDWTDHTCKGCGALWNASLCSMTTSSNDVTGNLKRVHFPECQPKISAVNAISYGGCEECQNTCVNDTYPDSFCGCSHCKREGAHTRTYVDSTGVESEAFCQITGCEDPSHTRVDVNGKICTVPCDSMACPSHQYTEPCLLPHNSRCVDYFPQSLEGQVSTGMVPGSANLFEVMHEPYHRWSSFENILITLAEPEYNRHQCVWDSAGILDSVFAPAGISSVFWPSGISSAYEYRERGTQHCRQRNPESGPYPLLPLQNSVSFPGDSHRRVSINASASVMAYSYVPYVGSELHIASPPAVNPDPGELLLALNMESIRRVQLHIHIPQDRIMPDWVNAWRLSFLIQELTTDYLQERVKLSVVELSPRKKNIPSWAKDGLGVSVRAAPSVLEKLVYAQTTGPSVHHIVPIHITSKSSYVASNFSITNTFASRIQNILGFGSTRIEAKVEGVKSVLFNEVMYNRVAMLVSATDTPLGHECLTIVSTMSGVYCVKADEMVTISRKPAHAIVYVSGHDKVLAYENRGDKPMQKYDSLHPTGEFSLYDVSDQSCPNVCECTIYRLKRINIIVQVTTQIPSNVDVSDLSALAMIEGKEQGELWVLLWWYGDFFFSIGKAQLSVERVSLEFSTTSQCKLPNLKTSHKLYLEWSSNPAGPRSYVDPCTLHWRYDSKDRLIVACVVRTFSADYINDNDQILHVFECDTNTGDVRALEKSVPPGKGYVSVAKVDADTQTDYSTPSSISTNILFGVGGTVYEMYFDMSLRQQDSHVLSGRHFIQVGGGFVTFENVLAPSNAISKPWECPDLGQSSTCLPASCAGCTRYSFEMDPIQCHATCMESEDCIGIISTLTGDCYLVPAYGIAPKSIVPAGVLHENDNYCLKSTDLKHPFSFVSTSVGFFSVVEDAVVVEAGKWSIAMAGFSLGAEPITSTDTVPVVSHRHGDFPATDYHHALNPSPTYYRMPSAINGATPIPTVNEWSWEMLWQEETLVLLYASMPTTLSCSPTASSTIGQCVHGYMILERMEDATRLNCMGVSAQVSSVSACERLYVHGVADIIHIVSHSMWLTHKDLQRYFANSPAYDRSEALDSVCYDTVEHSAMWWTCYFDRNATGFLFDFHASEVADSRVVGLDEITAHAILSDLEVSVDGEGWYTKVYVPHDKDLSVVGIESAISKHDWWRMHVTVGVFCGEGKCDPVVSLQRLTESSALSSEQHGLAHAGCSSNGVAVSNSERYASCKLEIPLHTLNSLNAVRVHVIGCDSVLRIDAFVQERTALWECPVGHFYSRTTGACQACGEQCSPGSRMTACFALSGQNLCEPCPPIPENAVFEERCQWRCDADFWLREGQCVGCTHGTCELGKRWVPCTDQQDGFCESCVLDVNAHFVAFHDDTCMTECDDGFFRSERGVCEACTSLPDLQLAANTARTAPQFFRFLSCTSVSDAFFEACEEMAGGSYTGDGPAFDTDCEAQCLPGWFQSAEVATRTSERTHTVALSAFESFIFAPAEWQQRVCVQCDPLHGLDGQMLPSHAYTLNRSCEFSCTPPYYSRHSSTCILCNESRCDAGTYLTGELCDTCQACVSKYTDSNFHFSGPGELDQNMSCTERCAEGMFNEFGLGVCKNFSQPACLATQFLQPGGDDYDNKCRDCSECNGRRLVVPCSESADAECADCEGELNLGEFWSGNACQKDCMEQFIFNTRTLTCELCQFVCDPGQTPAAPRQNCTHCTACTPPNTTNWRWIVGCDWGCSEGHELRHGQCIKNSGDNDMAVERTYSVRCPVGKTLSEAYECVPCGINTQTPDPDQENVTWKWQAVGEPCAWRCILPLIQHKIPQGTGVSCVSWDQYQTLVKLDTMKASIPPTASQPLSGVLSSWEIFTAMGCTLTLCVLIVTFKVRRDSSPGKQNSEFP